MNISHKHYMQRCLQLAKNGLGTTSPNPLVGCVIVHNGKIIGEGWHRKAGEPHAEVNAINAVKNKKLLSEATLYVNLEPCSHFGKTPPCSSLIIEKKIPTIVIGIIDSFSKVAGKGIKMLQNANRNVTVGVLEKECKAINKRFFTFHNKKRPYIILKWAESNDGFIAPLTKNEQKPVWISTEYSRQLVHKWRTEEQAILVGTTTILKDNPSLTARDYFGANPTRITFDNKHKIPEKAIIKNGSVPTFIFSEKKQKNVSLNYTTITVTSVKDIKNIIIHLYKNNIQSVIVEGGNSILQSFINANLWDEAIIFKGNSNLKQGVPAPLLKGKLINKKNIASDTLFFIKN